MKLSKTSTYLFLASSLLAAVSCAPDAPTVTDRAGAIEISVSVGAQSNIFGAGHGSPPAPGGGGGGILPTSVDIAGTPVVTFPSVTGTVSCCGPNAMNPPDGGGNASGNTDILSYGGISGIIHGSRTLFLVGVFLDGMAPSDPAPLVLDVTSANAQGAFAPALRQTFFIGDGRTSADALQTFNVPAGATRLFLGFADAFEFGNPQSPPGYYNDNYGTLTVTVALGTPAPPVQDAPGAGPLVSPVTGGCRVIRDYQEHLDDDSQPDSQAGVDYQIAGEPLSPYDPLTRSPSNMTARIVRAVAGGTIIDIVRLDGNNGNGTGNGNNQTPGELNQSVDPDIQPAEQYGILINVLSEDANNYLLAQYVHVFPTHDWVTRSSGAVDLPTIEEYVTGGHTAASVAAGRGTPGRKSYAYVDLPSTFMGRTAYGTTVTQGQELGFYAQIGRSTLPEGPHVHVSLFTLPKVGTPNLTAWLNNPHNTALGGQMLDPAEYIPCQ